MWNRFVSVMWERKNNIAYMMHSAENCIDWKNTLPRCETCITVLPFCIVSFLFSRFSIIWIFMRTLNHLFLWYNFNPDKSIVIVILSCGTFNRVKNCSFKYIYIDIFIYLFCEILIQLYQKTLSHCSIIAHLNNVWMTLMSHSVVSNELFILHKVRSQLSYFMSFLQLFAIYYYCCCLQIYLFIVYTFLIKNIY